MARKVIRVLSGFNRNAVITIQRGEPFTVGSQDDNSVILVDEGVAGSHCQFTLTNAGLICTALDSSLVIAGQTVAPGHAVKLADYQLIKCGSVFISAGDPAGDWNGLKNLDEASLEERLWQNSWKRFASKLAIRGRAVYGALGLLGVVVGIGIAYAAFMPGYGPNSKNYYTEATRWLKSIAPAGSELKLSKSKEGRLVLNGYVPTGYQSELLTMAANDSMYRPALEVYSVEQLVLSMSRLANLESLPCIVVYSGAGRLSCNNDIHDSAQATRLQTLAQQVPGVKALNLRPVTPVAPPDHLAVSPASLPDVSAGKEKKSEPGPFRDFNRKIYVVMTKNESYIVDSRGLKFHEGDMVDGFTVSSIQLDQVQLEREGQRYVVMVAIAK